MRIIELVLSISILIIFSPFLLTISLILLFDLRQSPFYFQERAITLDKKFFYVYKFRTLKEFQILSKDIFNKDELQPFTTKFTRWLRKTGIDELPQLINVIKGEMRLIGPRPLMISDLEILKEDDPYYYKIRKNIKSKPGITGMWQIFGDRSEGVKNLVSLDIYYELNKSIRLNWEILLLTAFVFLTARNSDAILDYKYNYKIRFVLSFINNRIKLLEGFNSSNLKSNNDNYKLSA